MTEDKITLPKMPEVAKKIVDEEQKKEKKKESIYYHDKHILDDNPSMATGETYPVGLKNAKESIKRWKGERERDSFYTGETEDKTEKEIKNKYLFSEFGKLTNYLEIARKFIEVQPVYYDKHKIWWIWNHQQYKWEMIDETDILNAIDEVTQLPSTNSTIKYSLLEGLRRQGRKKKPKEAGKSWVQFGNKIYDIENNEILDATPEYFITNPINWKLGESDKTPIFDELFISWVGEKHCQELYEIIAFSIVPNYFIHRLFCLIGSGANGKSTFLNILNKFIDEENITSSSLYLLLKGRFEGSKLVKKLVCLIGETNFDLISNTDYLKKLTGGDSIRAEFKGKDGFDYKNYAKLIMATNSLPPTADKTEGFYRRWKIIDFPNKFPIECDVLSKIPDKEYENLALKCLNIVKKLWKERIFTNDGDFEERRKRYEEKSNPLMLFIKENYKKDLNSEILFHDFFENFNNYLSGRGMRLLSAIAIARQLKNEGFDVRQMSKNKVSGRYIVGLTQDNKLKTNQINQINHYSTQKLCILSNEKKVNSINSVNLTAEDTPISTAKPHSKKQNEPNSVPEATKVSVPELKKQNKGELEDLNIKPEKVS